MKTLKKLVLIVFLSAAFNISYSQQFINKLKNTDRKLFSFGLIADPQYADIDSNGKRNYRNSIDKLETCVNELNRHDLSFTVTLGDLIDKEYTSFDKILPVLDKLEAPVYNLIGNHDFDVEDVFKKEVRAKMNNKKGYFEFKKGEFVFIGLDGTDLSTFASVKGSKQHDLAMAKYEDLKTAGSNNAVTWNGGIGNKQFKWLEKKLQKAKRENKKAILFCHWPLLPENMTQLWDNRKVLNLINKQECVVAWISGHHHAGEYHYIGNIHYLTLKGMVENEPSTFGIVEVYSDKIVLRGYGNQKDLVLKF